MDEIDSGSKCALGHPLMLVAEGYAYCYDANTILWHPWSLTAHDEWNEQDIIGLDGSLVPAWVGNGLNTKAWCIDIIQEDIEDRRWPRSEAAERARLMPV